MSRITKRWHIAPEAPVALLKQYKDIHPIIAQVLYNRGFETPESAGTFLYNSRLALDPFQMKDMQKAVDRITQAVHDKEPIVIYGDFDCDGVTSTTLLMDILTRLKADVEAYIPHRVDEGYGLNTEALEDLASQGKKLVITVDCGIRAVQEVDDGNAAGLDIIITDHHSVGDTIPDALAVINPQQDDCDGDTSLAGVGVAFMVARAILLDAWKRNGRQKKHLKLYTDLINNLTDLVAIGTVADIMSLASVSNRALVKQGLEVINSAQRPGIRALMKVAGLKAGQVTAMDIGFGLGPRINAAGRLESAMLAYELLAEDDFDNALEKAEELQALNVKRQKLTREASERVRAMLALNGSADANLIFAADEEVSQGIVGLVAGRLTEEYYRPAIILDMGATESHASCRSIPEFHITRVLDEHADLLLRHGGHAMAAGFSIANENIADLEAALTRAADKHLAGQTLTPTITIDKELDLRQLDMELVRSMAVLEPTGHNNTQPVFMTRNLEIHDKRRIGKDKSHLKMKLADKTQPPIDTIAFRLGDLCDDLPERIDVVYHLEVNEWQGRRNLQLNVLDLRPAE